MVKWSTISSCCPLLYQALMVVLLIGLSPGRANTAPTMSMTNLTLITTEHSWNTGMDVCAKGHGNLLNVMDQTMQNVLVQMDSVLTFQNDMWIGLHDQGRTSTDDYYWSNCQPLQSDWTNWNSRPLSTGNKLCVMLAERSLTWYTESCWKGLHILCAKSEGACTYELKQEQTCSLDVPKMDVDAASLVDCQERCNTEVNGSNVCWGYIFYHHDEKCQLILGSNPYFCENDLELMEDHTLGLRRCFNFFSVNTARAEDKEVDNPLLMCPKSASTTTVTTTFTTSLDRGTSPTTTSDATITDMSSPDTSKTVSSSPEISSTAGSSFVTSTATRSFPDTSAATISFPDTSATTISFLDTSATTISFPDTSATTRSFPDTSATTISFPDTSATTRSFPDTSAATRSFPDTSAATRSFPDTSATTISFPDTSATTISFPDTSATTRSFLDTSATTISFHDTSATPKSTSDTISSTTARSSSDPTTNVRSPQDTGTTVSSAPSTSSENSRPNTTVLSSMTTPDVSQSSPNESVTSRGNVTCICICLSGNTTGSLLSLKALIENLLLDKRNLSAYRRKYISADDDRPSAQSLGVGGVTFLILSVLFVVAADLNRVFSSRGGEQIV